VATIENSENSAGITWSTKSKEKSMDLIVGLMRFKTGILLQLISTIFSVFFSILILAKILPSIPYYIYMGFCGLAFIIYILFFTSTDFFRRYHPAKLKVGHTGMTLAMIGWITTIAGIISTILTVGTSMIEEFAAGDYISFFESLETSAIMSLIWVLLIVVAGAIIFFIGYVLFLIFIFRIGEIPGAKNYIKIGGIVLIIGWIVSLMPSISIAGTISSFIAWFLIYTGIDCALSSSKMKYAQLKN
jgi:hypothetical protein